MRDRLRHDLTLALKARDSVAVAALRSAIAAIDNAEAVDADGVRPSTTSEHIAGATEGVGSSEVARRELGVSEVREILRTQVEERSLAAAEYEKLGREDAAARLRREASLLGAYLSLP